MGSHMASNLFLRLPNLDLFVYDINKAVITNFVTSLSTKNPINGASLFAGDSIKEIAQKAQLVITMLPNNEIVSKVYEDEILPNIGKNSLLLDSSTVSPEIVINLEEKAKAKGCAFIDAPVSGGKRLRCLVYLY